MVREGYPGVAMFARESSTSQRWSSALVQTA
jgi:hypothetical protein